jgi:hypothetical protein
MWMDELNRSTPAKDHDAARFAHGAVMACRWCAGDPGAFTKWRKPGKEQALEL